MRAVLMGEASRIRLARAFERAPVRQPLAALEGAALAVISRLHAGERGSVARSAAIATSTSG
jgi:hypothetical protein